MKMARELRSLHHADRTTLRMEGDDGEPKRIVGVASVFYDGTPRTEYQLWSDVYERIASTAFDRAMREGDVRALFNHDSNQLLGRFRAANSDGNTLRIWKEPDGLHYSVDPSGSDVYRNVSEMLSRGDLDGSSFQFYVLSEEITRDTERGLIIRTITDVELLDVGPVTFPAYSSTSSGLRSAEQEATRIREAAKAAERVVEDDRERAKFVAEAYLLGT